MRYERSFHPTAKLQYEMATGTAAVEGMCTKIEKKTTTPEMKNNEDDNEIMAQHRRIW